MNSSSFANLWPALWDDLQGLDVLWQIGVLIACLGAGWAIAHLLRRKLMSAKKEALAERLGVERFTVFCRLCSPRCF